MSSSFRKLALALASAGLIALQGCGGGGGTSTGTSPTPTATVSGVAASGAGFEGATIVVKDSTGATVGTSSAVGADGQYTITLDAGATAPFVLIATRTSADGASESLVSVVPALSGTSATANITPITHLIASRLADSGDPLKLADELAADPTQVTEAAVTAKVQEVQDILGPLLTATGTTATDPLTGSFSTDGTGYDRLLDSIKVTIIPYSDTAANIEVAVKQATADDADPVAIKFTSDTDPASIPDLPAIDPGDLIEEGTATRIAALLTQLNTCFALPVAERVDTPDPASPTLASPNESNIIAPECRDAFIQDGGGSILFKHNGATISAVTDRPFFGLFRSTATGLTYSQGAYEFTRANGDIVISYKRTSAGGAEVFDTFVVRKDAADGDKLKLIGNQYQFPGSIAAYHQLRRFITLNQSGWDYYSTGYNLNVPNLTSGGSPVFDRVVVTTPRGTMLTLKPTAGSSYLVLVKDPGGADIKTGTSFVRLNSEYVDAANTADPALKDTTMFFADRTVFTNEAIAAIPMQAVWKYEYYLASDPATLAATQHYKTRARALTIPELKTKGLAVLSDADITTFQSGANPTGGPRPGQFPVGDAPSISIGYTVPTGALPPTQLMVWGSYTGGSGSFNDAAAVLSTARTGTIYCTKATAGDAHCQTAVDVGDTGPYGLTAALNGLHLRAIEPTGREYASFYAMYELP